MTLRRLVYHADPENDFPRVEWYANFGARHLTRLTIDGSGFQVDMDFGDCEMARLQVWIDEVLTEHQAAREAADKARTAAAVAKITGKAVET